jgi:hypothetical protein
MIIIMLAIAIAPGLATAIELAGVTEFTFQWSAASGNIDWYGVYVARNGEARPLDPSQVVPENDVVISGEAGDSLRVWVAAFDQDGFRGPLSVASDLIELVAEGDE